MGILTAAALVGVLALAGPPYPGKQTSEHTPGGASSTFEDVSGRATRTREAGRLDEAAALYREALRLQPGWSEGWWFLGSLAYEGDRYAECREAFEQLLQREPQIGPAWALRGLCEFALQDYPTARAHLDHALEVGPVADDPIWWVVLYHQAILQIRDGEFERTLKPLSQLAARGDPSPELQEACGLRLLRRAQLPADVPAESRELVRAVGRAECAALGDRRTEADERFRTLLAEYPRERNLNYGHGLLLAQSGSVEAIDAFRREVELYPDHVLAHIELAFNLLKHGRPDEAARVAETAVRLDPEDFVTHLALGRALVAAGDITLGIFALESAARLAPGSADVFFALGRAYASAGRRVDAERANDRFRELDQARRSGASP